jgi:hypothetical protein
MIMMPYDWPWSSLQLTGQADFWHPTGSRRWSTWRAWVKLCTSRDRHPASSQLQYTRRTKSSVSRPAYGTRSKSGESNTTEFSQLPRPSPPTSIPSRPSEGLVVTRARGHGNACSTQRRTSSRDTPPGPRQPGSVQPPRSPLPEAHRRCPGCLKTPRPGCLETRQWWQVLGSNQRRLSR